MRTFERIFVAANQWALILLLGAMSAIVFANVVLRYTTNFSIVWAEEVARFLMIWMMFLGAGLALRVGGLVAISNLQDALSENLQRVIRLLIVVVLIVFFAVMIWIGYDYASRVRFQMTPATRISFSMIYGAIPIGFALLGIHLLLIARGFIRESRFKAAEAADDVTMVS